MDVNSDDQQDAATGVGEVPRGPARSVEEAIASRRSIRAFLPTPVEPELLDRILELGARAPSGSNIQPWQVLVLTGAPLEALGRELSALALAGDRGEEAYAYYPRNWREPYLARRRAVGWDLYAALGITRRETERMAAQQARNFTFFVSLRRGPRDLSFRSCVDRRSDP